jgi:hypothetical protein
MDYERAVLSGSPMTRPTFSRNLRPSAQQVIFFVEELTFSHGKPWRPISNYGEIESVSLAWLSTQPQCRLTIAG